MRPGAAPASATAPGTAGSGRCSPASAGPGSRGRARWRGPATCWQRGGCATIGVGLARELLGAGASPDPISLSLAAHRRGLRNVYWPFARFQTEDRLAPVDLAEPVEDPYLNPNLAPGASTLS
jgi:hypothetical protein